MLTDYTGKYEDIYLCEAGQWLIKYRIDYFIIIQVRSLAH